MDARSKQLPGLGAILMLTLGFLHAHLDAGGLVHQIHSRGYLVHALSARTGGTGYVLFDLVLVDVHFQLFRLRQDGHRGGRGMHPPLRLGGRHALHAMHAAFVAKPLPDAVAFDVGHRMTQPALVAGHEVERFKLPPMQGRVTLIHLEQFARPQPGLGAAGPGP